MDMTNDYITETVNAQDAHIGDVASIIALAILESKGDHAKAIAALEHATQALRDRPIGQQAEKCFSEAIHNIEIFQENRALGGDL